MAKRTSLKAVPTEKPEPLTYEAAQRLAQGIARDAIEEEGLLGALMIFTRELIDHCFDASHVETMAIALEDHLYAVTLDCDRASRRFIEERRAEFLKGGAR